ncbi:zinc ribbon domain-containing protein [Butyrivibrio sp. X503]|uniref:zinc ribbon domain-containing protein n=1 Tax=Butyrivibrio sp. X503 TaxID=2364878 RepID=UPI000EAA0B1D|nr:zinc ribbon domain-containing protein [Butyrivibrio sp. X503]RKM57323.1 zinc ribbon domain-containing protein [Butyrivibrio sp. X503]
MKCTNCGYKVKESAKYCPICGNPMIKLDDGGWEKVEVEERIFKDTSEPVPNISDAVEQYNIKKKKEIKKEINVAAIIFTILFAFIACLIVIPNFWSIYYSFKSPVVSEFIDPESDIVNLAENDGVLYNNRGVVNKEFKGKLSNMIFIPAGHIGVVIDDDMNLYFINCEDLTTEYIDHAVGYSCSYYGATLYYIDDNSRLHVNDLANRETWIHKTNGEVLCAAMSPNSGYLCSLESWYDVNEGPKYKICVVDKEDKPVYEYDLGDQYYDLLSMSNDGDTVYLSDLYSTNTYYCLHDGKLDAIYSPVKTYSSEVYLNGDQNKMMIIDEGKVLCHSAGESECKEVFSSSDCLVYPKTNIDVMESMHFILEDNFDGTVIFEDDMGDGKYYWLDEDLNPVPFAQSDVGENAEAVTGEKGDYKFLYTYDGDIHYATFNDGKVGDVTLKEGDDRIYKIVSDETTENIWISTVGNDIFHVSGDAIERIYSYEGGRDCPDLAYDSLTEFVYYTTPDKKLVGVDKVDDVKMEIKGVEGFAGGTQDSGDIVFEFKGGAKYRIIFDKLIRYSDD